MRLQSQGHIQTGYSNSKQICVSDGSNYAGHDQYQLHWEQELGLPWINSDTWEAISPFNDMANVQVTAACCCKFCSNLCNDWLTGLLLNSFLCSCMQTPTLVVCGEVCHQHDCVLFASTRVAFQSEPAANKPYLFNRSIGTFQFRILTSSTRG